MTERNKGYLFIMIASLLFAMIGIFGKLAMNTGIGPFQLLVYQYAVMSVLLGTFLTAARPRSLRVSRRKLLYMMIQGVIGTTGTTIFFYMAIDRLNVGISSMLLFTYPVFVNAFFMFSGIRKINRYGKIALISAFIGSLLVLDILSAGFSGLSAVGILLGILSSLCYSFYNIFADLKLSDTEPLVISFYTSLAALATGVVLVPEVLSSPISLNVEMIGYLIMLAVVSGIFPIVLIYRGIALIGADKASVVSCSELPITVVLAYLILGEIMNQLQVIGIFCIVAAVLLLHRNDVETMPSKVCQFKMDEYGSE